MARTKFRCNQIQHAGDRCTIYFSPVHDPQNPNFFMDTPGGSFFMACVSPEEAAKFEEAKAYYLDFTDCGEPPIPA